MRRNDAKNERRISEDPKSNKKPAAYPYGHDWCIACGSRNPLSMNLTFNSDKEGEVFCDVMPRLYLQGYEGVVHGGVISTLLDAAMTHCLFQKGVRALTGDLHVRFLHPVSCNDSLHLRASVVVFRRPLFRLKSELFQGGELKAWAEASFIKKGDRQ